MAPTADPWRLNPDGSVSFETPAGPLASFGPDAAVEMARRDAAQGVQRPLSFYQQAARPQSMATSPQALAYGPEADADMSRADAPPAAPPPEASFQPPQLNASTEAPAAPPLGAAGAQGPALPEGWGKYAIDKPLKDTWAERKTLEGQPAADRIRYPSVGPSQGAAPEAPPPAPAAEAQRGATAPAAVDPARVVTTGPRPGGGPGGGGGGKVFADARRAIDESTRFGQEAVEASERSRLAGDTRQAEVMREQNAIEATRQAGQEARLEEMQRRSAQFQAKISQALDDADKMKVDPGRWYSSKSVGQKILLNVGFALAGFGGKRNDVAEMIGRQTDADIRSQIENRDAKLKQASATQSLYRDYLATFKDHEEALLATATTAKLGIAKQAMAQALEIGSPEQIARAEELHAKLLEQQAGLYMNLAQQRAAAAAKGSGAAKVKPPRQIMINGRSFEVRPNVTDAEYNKLAEEAQKVDRVYRTVEQASSDRSAPPGFFERLAASTLGYKTEAVIRAEANADSVQSADSQLSGEGTSSETAVKTGREKYGGPNKQAGLAEERKKADAAAIDLKRRATQ